MENKALSYVIAVTLGTIMVSGMVSWGLVASDTTYAATTVPGHSGARYDADDNGYPDQGMAVNGKYVSVYAYDENGDSFWDLGDGRIQGSVSSLGELDQETLTTCVYQVQYRGMFQNDAFLDTGWIKNEINCSGYDDDRSYNYTIVHKTDPRYRGNPAWAVWGDWEYHVATESHEGNLARPERHLGE